MHKVPQWASRHLKCLQCVKCSVTNEQTHSNYGEAHLDLDTEPSQMVNSARLSSLCKRCFRLCTLLRGSVTDYIPKCPTPQFSQPDRATLPTCTFASALVMLSRLLGHSLSQGERPLAH